MRSSARAPAQLHRRVREQPFQLRDRGQRRRADQPQRVRRRDPNLDLAIVEQPTQLRHRVLRRRRPGDPQRPQPRPRRVRSRPSSASTTPAGPRSVGPITNSASAAAERACDFRCWSTRRARSVRTCSRCRRSRPARPSPIAPNPAAVPDTMRFHFGPRGLRARDRPPSSPAVRPPADRIRLSVFAIFTSVSSRAPAEADRACPSRRPRRRGRSDRSSAAALTSAAATSGEPDRRPHSPRSPAREAERQVPSR